LIRLLVYYWLFSFWSVLCCTILLDLTLSLYLIFYGFLLTAVIGLLPYFITFTYYYWPVIGLLNNVLLLLSTVYPTYLPVMVLDCWFYYYWVISIYLFLDFIWLFIFRSISNLLNELRLSTLIALTYCLSYILGLNWSKSPIFY